MAIGGEVVAIEPLRHTPAGIPMLHFRLLHRSRREEAGFKRDVECEIAAVAMAETARSLARLRSGESVTVSGFLDRKNRMSTQLVLHVTAIQSTGEGRHGSPGGTPQE